MIVIISSILIFFFFKVLKKKKKIIKKLKFNSKEIIKFSIQEKYCLKYGPK
jgi:hypothetical protein